MISTGFGRRWIAVTLTGYLVPREWVGQNVAIFADAVRDFLKHHYLGGLIVIEHTVKPDGYFIHAHALVIGDFKKQADLEAEWGRFVWLQDMRFDPRGHSRSNHATVSAGLSYLLKYVTKGVALNDDELEQVKGLRYISTFGELYNMRLPVWRSRCKYCHGPVAVGKASDIEYIEKEHMSKGQEPLEIERVISWPQKQPKETPDERKARIQRARDYIEGLWRDKAMPTGLNLLVRWLLSRPGQSVAESVSSYV